MAFGTTKRSGKKRNLVRITPKPPTPKSFDRYGLCAFLFSDCTHRFVLIWLWNTSKIGWCWRQKRVPFRAVCRPEGLCGSIGDVVHRIYICVPHDIRLLISKGRAMRTMCCRRDVSEGNPFAVQRSSFALDTQFELGFTLKKFFLCLTTNI